MPARTPLALSLAEQSRSQVADPAPERTGPRRRAGPRSPVAMAAMEVAVMAARPANSSLLAASPPAVVSPAVLSRVWPVRMENPAYFRMPTWGPDLTHASPVELPFRPRKGLLELEDCWPPATAPPVRSPVALGDRAWGLSKRFSRRSNSRPISEGRVASLAVSFPAGASFPQGATSKQSSTAR